VAYILLAGLTVSAVVIDGVTIGRPTCGVHNCKTPLDNNRHRFCPDHINMNNICAVVGCDNGVAPTKRTCGDPTHQETERIHTERGQAQFQLKERLARARVAHPNNAFVEETDPDMVAEHEGDFDVPEEEFDVVGDQVTVPHIADGALDILGPATKKKIRAQFGRKRTHNEQIIVCPCGIIVARETFFGAEAIPSVVVRISLFSLMIF
jgi:CxC6 like cysteine cluster associated with KDZ transposases